MSMKEEIVSFLLRRALCYLFFCSAAVALLTFCGDDSNDPQTTSDPDTSASASLQDNTSQSTTPPDTAPQTEPEHRFIPATITAGLPFSFELVWLGKSYRLSLDNCGSDTRLLQGMWPASQTATTHIEGQDGARLDNLVIVNTRGDPTIPSDCQLKVTVDQGKASEASAPLALEVKAGTIALSDVRMLTKTITLNVRGVANTVRSALVVGKRATSTIDSVARTEYRFVAVSSPLTNAVQNNAVADDVSLYKPALPPTEPIDAFASGDYLVSVVVYRITGFDLSAVEFLHSSAIEVSKD